MGVFGGRSEPAMTGPEIELARLTAHVDQAVAIVDEAMRTNRANRQLVDLALDVKNTLTKARQQ